MKANYKPGIYVDYPCLACGSKMKLKTNLNKLSTLDIAAIECSDCKIEKEYTVGELKAIINSNY